MNMKKQLITFMMIFLGLSWDEDNHLPVIEPEDSGVFTDAEGREFSWVRYGNLEWMTTNLNIEASYGYEISHERTRNPIELEAEKEQNYATFGYLYTYEAALEVVPEGWRIPTDEDWQELEKAMGKRVKYDRLARSFRGRTIATSGRDQDQPPHGRNGRI